MENVISNFESPEISIQLSDEKLYIKTISTSETFALRSINGIGIVDLVERYNQELSQYNQKKSPWLHYVFGALLMIGGLASLFDDKTEGNEAGSSFLFILLGALLFYFGNKRKGVEPTLKTAVRIMISGVNRDFEFDKTGPYADQIAELVVKIEETLTSYHKKNN